MKLDILLGFDNESVKKIIQENLEKNGYDVTIACRTTKKAVKEYVQKNPDCNVVVLQEAIGLDKYKYADEVTALTDNRDVNVVFVISERHKGTDYVARLYSAGITGVLFQVNRSGVSVKDICKQIVKPRSRKEAREYYGISESDSLENYSSPEVDKSMELYEMFINGEGNVIENFFHVCNVAELDMPQIAGFIKRLPSETKTELAQYEEFHQVLSFLRAGGIDVGIKKPKRLSVGLKSDTKYEVGARGVRLVSDDNEETEEKQTAEVDLSNLSMEELFARAMSGDTEAGMDESTYDEQSEPVEDNKVEADLEDEPEEEFSQKELDKLEYERKKQEARELEAERKAAQLKEREEKRRQAEEEREEKRRIAEEEKEEKRRIAAIEKEKNLAKKQEEDAIRAKEREEEKAKRKEVFDEKKAQFLGNMKAIGNKMKEDQAERAKLRELLAKEKEKQAEEKEFVWDEEDDDVLLDAGGTSVGFGIGMIIFIVILVALIGFVGWLSMGNHISIGGFKI